MDPYDLQGQKKAKEEQALDEKMKRESEENDFRWLMSSKRGRRIIFRLLQQRGVFSTSFNPTAMHMAFLEGNRNSGLILMDLIHRCCIELYPTMWKENANGREHRDNEQ